MSDFTDLRILGGLRREGGGKDAHQRIKLPPGHVHAAVKTAVEKEQRRGREAIPEVISWRGEE